MKDSDFAFAVGYVRAVEAGFLNKSDIVNLKNSGSLNEFFNKLKILNIIDKKLYSLEDLDFTLENKFIETFYNIVRICPKKTPFELIYLKNDFLNFYSILTSITLKNDWKKLILKPFSIEPASLETSIKEKKASKLPNFLQEIFEEVLQKTIIQFNVEKLSHLLKKKLYETMLKISKKHEFLFEKTRLEITLKNLCAAFTFLKFKENETKIKSYFIDGGLIDNDIIIKFLKKDLQGLKLLFMELDLSIKNFKFNNYFELKAVCIKIVENFYDKYRFKTFGFEPIFIFLENLKKQYSNFKKIAATIRFVTNA